MHARHQLLHALTLILVLAGALSLLLYVYGAWWWFAPLVGAGVLLSHLAILGGGLVVAARARRVSRNTIAHHHPSGTGRDGSMLLHRPRLFDWTTWAFTLGRETALRRWMLDLAGLQPGDAVLDVGCGTGTLLLAAAPLTDPSGALHGIDLAPEMAAHARRKAADRRIPLQVVEGSADSLPYPPLSFDAAFCTLVLHHLPEARWEGVIREMRRVLRPAGRVVLVDWQRPKSLFRALASPMFPVYLLHNLGSKGSPLDVLPIERLLAGLGFTDITRHAFGTAGGIGAVVGRLAAGGLHPPQAGTQ